MAHLTSKLQNALDSRMNEVLDAQLQDIRNGEGVRHMSELSILDFAMYAWDTEDNGKLSHDVVPTPERTQAEPLPRRADNLIPGSPEAIEAMAAAVECGLDLWDTENMTPADMDEIEPEDMDWSDDDE